jgi:hypothetical protein
MSKPLSPAAQAVLTAQAKQRCLFEWSNVNDPPCHPSDPDWNGCVQCIDRLGAAAALRAATDHGEYMVDPVDGKTAVVRVADLQAWAAELETPADDVPPVEQSITGNGSGASLPPSSNEPRVWEPLPLWLVMARAEAKECGSDAYLPLNFSSRCIQAWAPVIEALRDYLLLEEGLTPMLPGGYDETRTRWEERQRLRAQLTEQAAVARQAGPH